MKINKIIVTGDMLRPSVDGKENDQKINITWLYHLLKFPLSQSTSINIEVLNWEQKSGAFDSKKFYKLNNHESMPKDWIALYHSSNFSKASLKYMKKYFDNTLVIGFELPEIFMKMFDELNITYIDLIIHPIRYMDDVFFGIRTNHPSIFQKVKQHQLHSQTFSIYAGIHNATVSRMPKKWRFEKNSALFTGQVEIDKSLIKDGKILSILDYKEEFSNIAKRYKKVYFKKHPYAKGNNEVDAFLQTFKNIEFIDENFYYLLRQEEIEAVYSISSSTVLEAKYWGKESDYFHKNPFNLLHDDDHNFNTTAYLPVYEKFLLPYFWSDVLSDVIETSSMPHIELPEKPNRLRNSLQNYWGYNFLDIDILLKHADTFKYSSTGINIKEKSVVDILEYLQPEIGNKRRELEGMNNSGLKKVKKPSLFHRYQNSRWMGKAQRIKHIPYIGSSLLYVKRKVLK